MRRRQFLIGIGAAATGGAATVGSGAFSSVAADRDVTVEVADDSDAYLTLEPGEENGEYAEVTNGTLGINFDGGAGVAGEGFNRNAETTVDDLFSVRNQGTQRVVVSLAVADISVTGDANLKPRIITQGGDAVEIEIVSESVLGLTFTVAEFILRLQGSSIPNAGKILGVGDEVPISARFNESNEFEGEVLNQVGLSIKVIGDADAVPA